MTRATAFVRRPQLWQWRAGIVGVALSFVLQTLSFSVGAQAPFAVTSPAEGSVVVPGQPVTVQWTGGDSAWLVDVQLVDWSINQVVAGVAASVPNTGSLTWTIPVTLPFGLKACGRTSMAFAVTNVQRTSWAYGPVFSTAPCPFAITSPAAGAVLTPGQPVTIQWTGGDPNWLVGMSLIDWSVGVIEPIVGNIPNSGSFTWTLPVTTQWGLHLCGRTLQIALGNVQQTSWIYGPDFTTTACVPPNAPPTAFAGANLSVRVGTTVTLHGNAVDDNTPFAALAFSWTLRSRPTGSGAWLVNPDTPTPSFVADQAGTYVFQLIVTDEGGLNSAPSLVVISSLNQAPTANAGADQLVVVFQTVQLDGSGSSDPDNDSIGFSWSIASAPAGSTAVLNGRNTATPNFQPDQPGTYTIALSVSDFVGPGTPDTVEITATTAAAFAEQSTLVANQLVLSLGTGQITAVGNQTAFSTFLNVAVKANQAGDTKKAIDKLNEAIARTDGCERNGVPDGPGPGRDWVTDCSAQAQLLAQLRAAVRALTP
jgi:hypothetical protein